MCDYCVPDSKGYIISLPKVHNSNSLIIEKEYMTPNYMLRGYKVRTYINYCPICGRKLDDNK